MLHVQRPLFRFKSFSLNATSKSRSAILLLFDLRSRTGFHQVLFSHFLLGIFDVPAPYTLLSERIS